MHVIKKSRFIIAVRIEYEIGNDICVNISYFERPLILLRVYPHMDFVFFLFSVHSFDNASEIVKLP